MFAPLTSKNGRLSRECWAAVLFALGPPNSETHKALRLRSPTREHVARLVAKAQTANPTPTRRGVLAVMPDVRTLEDARRLNLLHPRSTFRRAEMYVGSRRSRVPAAAEAWQRRPMSRRSLNDGAASFDVTVFEAAIPSRVVLFAVGGGGDPERHLPLLTVLAEQGCTVIAPHFERLTSSMVSDDDLRLRGRRLNIALDALSPPGLRVAGVGHSIGTTMLIALAGGRVWMRRGDPLALERCPRLDKLALFTPATGFFKFPGSLDAVRTQIMAWAGTYDTITPQSHAEFLAHTLGDRVPVDIRIVEGAGHFSFMNVPPPHTTEPLRDRDTFLRRLTSEVCRFVVR